MRRFGAKTAAIIVIALALVISGLLLRHRATAPATDTVAGADGANNQSRRKFLLPAGPETYRIAQAAEDWPKFVQATIDPPDVHVGDIQKLEVIIEDPDAITVVEARIETDHDTKILPLEFQGEVAEAALAPARYAVGADNQLVFLPAQNRAGVRTAAAAEYPKLKYAAEWKVVDTHDARYHTTFIVKDAKGREGNITLAWSDACAIPNSGDWDIAISAPCTISGLVDGVDNGNVTISTSTLTLSSSATFGFNPGKKVTITAPGKIVISSGSKLQQTYVWKPDADTDGYPASSPQAAQDTQPAGYIRKSSNADDCNDATRFVYQTLTVIQDCNHNGYYYNSAAAHCVGGAANYTHGCTSGVGSCSYPYYQDPNGNYPWTDQATTLGSDLSEGIDLPNCAS